ncbi:zinc-binding dehydrogenase [Polymorphobacter sp.]|uniref:zinc-binding dehydrogenase n=1 Tax=Polymorphobacter sp. TaxID=1909290 RepID=UPI003F713462
MRQQKIVLAKHPVNLPVADDFSVINEELPAIADGEFLARVLYLGIEPRLRLMLNPTTEWNKDMRPHGGMAGIGRVIPGSAVATVVESRNDRYPVGALVEGMLGWQRFAVTTGAPHPTNNPEGIAVCDTSLSAEPRDFLAVLGTPGLTAYLALKYEGKLQPGDTVVITSAAGLVGSIAGQLAKMQGARVIGITSTRDKMDYLSDTLGFDAVISYRDTPDLGAAVAAVAPDGVDYYFDNVGGDMAEQIKSHLSPAGRVTRCGIVSAYTKQEWAQSKAFAGQFSVHNHVEDYPEARRELARYLKEGKLSYESRTFESLEHAPEALKGVLESKNIGKWFVRVSDL